MGQSARELGRREVVEHTGTPDEIVGATEPDRNIISSLPVTSSPFFTASTLGKSAGFGAYAA